MVQLYSVILHVLIYSSSLSNIVCLLNQSVDDEAVVRGGIMSQHEGQSTNHYLGSRKPGLHGDRSRHPINDNHQIVRPKKIINPTITFDQGGIVKNISALPTKGVFEHTNRPGTLIWKTPKLKLEEQSKSSKDIILGPVYRLPVDHDDTGSQIRMEWAYANLKVRPEKLTLEAIGPNKATWTISVMEGTKTTATWDLRETPSYSPLIEGYYTLRIHDQRGQDSLPKPGWLLPDEKMKVALYRTTEGNNHVGEYIAPSECATCYKHIMQGLGKLEDSTEINHVNFKLIFMLMTFLWILL